MNGRVYDYNLGRFMSVDPVIQSPTNSQSINPYPYIMNNPLSGTDPTGYESIDVSGIRPDCGGPLSCWDKPIEDQFRKQNQRSGNTSSSSNSSNGAQQQSSAQSSSVETADIGSPSTTAKGNNSTNVENSGFGGSTPSSKGEVKKDGDYTEASYKGKGYTLNYSIEGSDEFKAEVAGMFSALGELTTGKMMLRGIARTKGSLLITESIRVGIGDDIEGFDVFLSYSSKWPQFIGTTLGKQEIRANPGMVFAHELHHVWDRLSGGKAMNLGKPVEGLPARETYAVRFTNRIRKELKYGYQRNTYRRPGKTYEIPLR